MEKPHFFKSILSPSCMSEGASPKVEEVVEDNEKITLKLIDQDGTILEFRVKKSVSFRKILDAFAQNVGKDATELRMLFNGKVLNMSQTPYDLALDNNEELEVVASQTGGQSDAMCKPTN